jgi:hypothetical protein
MQAAGNKYIFSYLFSIASGGLYGVVAGVSGYRSRGSVFDSRRYQFFCVVVCLERGPHSLVRRIEELLE